MFRNFKLKKIYNIKKNISIKRVEQETRVSKTIPNIEITCHNEDIV